MTTQPETRCPACGDPLTKDNLERRFIIAPLLPGDEPAEIMEHTPNCGKWLWRRQKENAK